MLEPRERLSLATEAREDELGIHPRSHQFDRDLGAVLVVIAFCKKDRAHTAAAKLSHQSIGTDPRRRAGGCARLLERLERDVDSLLDEPARSRVMARKERPHFAAHLFVRSRDSVDQRGSLAGRRGQRQVEELADRLPSIRSHGSPRDSSRWSQASASRCSRPIVPTETFSARAVSSTLSPTEEPQLDHLGFARVHRRQCVERIVERHDVVGLHRHDGDDLVERRRHLTAAALLAAVTTGVVDEDLAHEMGGDAKEM